MDGTFFPYRAGEKCMQNVIWSTELEVLLQRYRIVRVDNIKMNLKERTFNILILSHPIQCDCFRHVSEFSVFQRMRSISKQWSFSLRLIDFVP
jgi:hypothetical protein